MAPTPALKGPSAFVCDIPVPHSLARRMCTSQWSWPTAGTCSTCGARCRVGPGGDARGCPSQGGSPHRGSQPLPARLGGALASQPRSMQARPPALPPSARNVPPCLRRRRGEVADVAAAGERAQTGARRGAPVCLTPSCPPCCRPALRGLTARYCSCLIAGAGWLYHDACQLCDDSTAGHKYCIVFQANKVRRHGPLLWPRR